MSSLDDEHFSDYKNDEQAKGRNKMGVLRTNQQYFFFWVVVSNIFYFHPYLGRWSNLTNIFQMGWNHQLVFFVGTNYDQTGTLFLVVLKHFWIPSGRLSSLRLTAEAPENWWLEYDPFLLGFSLFSGENLVHQMCKCALLLFFHHIPETRPLYSVHESCGRQHHFCWWVSSSNCCC